MKKSFIAIIVLLVIVGIAVLWYQGVYNGMVQADENVKSVWGNVESQYQRRSDLIGNLVETVKGYATHEKETFEAVTNARAGVTKAQEKAAQTTIDSTKITEESMAQYQAAQGELSSAYKSYISINVEAYPELKANENFIKLQDDLAGTENRIATARMRFNEAAQTYNTMIRKFPNNIIAGMSGFAEKPYFKAEAGAEKAPEVKF